MAHHQQSSNLKERQRLLCGPAQAFAMRLAPRSAGQVTRVRQLSTANYSVASPLHFNDITSCPLLVNHQHFYCEIATEDFIRTRWRSCCVSELVHSCPPKTPTGQIQKIPKPLGSGISQAPRFVCGCLLSFCFTEPVIRSFLSLSLPLAERFEYASYISRASRLPSGKIRHALDSRHDQETSQQLASHVKEVNVKCAAERAHRIEVALVPCIALFISTGFSVLIARTGLPSSGTPSYDAILVILSHSKMLKFVMNVYAMSSFGIQLLRTI